MKKLIDFVKALLFSENGVDSIAGPDDTGGDDPGANTGDMPDGLDAIEALPELQDKPDGHKCRVEVTVEKTPDGMKIVSAKYLAPIGGKSPEEYLGMPKDKRDQYDADQVLGGASSSGG